LDAAFLTPSPPYLIKQQTDERLFGGGFFAPPSVPAACDSSSRLGRVVALSPHFESTPLDPASLSKTDPPNRTLAALVRRCAAWAAQIDGHLDDGGGGEAVQTALQTVGNTGEDSGCHAAGGGGGDTAGEESRGAQCGVAESVENGENGPPGWRFFPGRRDVSGSSSSPPRPAPRQEAGQRSVALEIRRRHSRDPARDWLLGGTGAKALSPLPPGLHMYSRQADPQADRQATTAADRRGLCRPR